MQTSGMRNGSLCALTAHWRGGDELQKVQSLAEDTVLQKNEKRKKKNAPETQLENFFTLTQHN